MSSTELSATTRSTKQPLPVAELDSISFERLRVRANHGVYEHEREEGQDFFIDATVWTDTRAAAQSDDIDDTVHYGQLMRAIHASAEDEPVDLLETLAERLARVALSFRGAQAVRITIHKPEAPVPLDFADVSVSILRFQSEMCEDTAVEQGTNAEAAAS